jgi:hypothetical protein
MNIAIAFVGLEKANLAAFRYLLLQLNNLQTHFEFDLTPEPRSAVVEILSQKKPVERSGVKQRLGEFYEDYMQQLRREYATDQLTEPLPEYYVILVTRARFRDHYYSARQGRVSVIALGEWKRVMAPPSILEFILTLVVRESVAAAAPSMRGSVHMGTRGCLFDFTPQLEDLRIKVLGGYVCARCADSITADGCTQLVPQLRVVLAKKWFGKTTDLDSPAAVTAKLGYNLFATKGLRSSALERVRSALEEESAKSLIQFLFAIALAALVFKAGWK